MCSCINALAAMATNPKKGIEKQDGSRERRLRHCRNNSLAPDVKGPGLISGRRSFPRRSPNRIQKKRSGSLDSSAYGV